MKQVAKTYDSKKYEKKIYSLWEKNESFKAEPQKNKKQFSIIMPPPNANDPLHTGHAIFLTIEDILIRYHRMANEVSLWLPGADHAGIETQYVFEKKLAKQGKSRFDFDRSTLYKMIYSYVKQNSKIVINQMKKIGASADWSKFKFTLDDDIIKLVLTTFKKLSKDNLIYRAQRLVNYCTHCGTGYSELEVEYQEKQDKLYFIKYPIINNKTNSKQAIIVATTRPETMFGDTAVAVNPKDKRYQDLVGKFVELPLTNRQIPVISDEMVDINFGSGALKITPFHSKADWEIAKRHNLEMIQVIDFTGRMNSNALEFEGLKIKEAREKVVEKLKELGYLQKEIDYTHEVGVCYRCGTIIEPLPLAQFFVKTKPLAKKALKALDKKETLILGAGREKILRNWLKNIEDWNISRQIVWGIRIPVYYKVSQNPELIVEFLNYNKQLVKGEVKELLKNYSFKEIKNGLQSLKAPTNAKFIVSLKEPKGKYLQETDVFDTWFSSGQWPVITLKANGKKYFDYFYPTTVMETGYDILTRWVMRMMLLGIYLTGRSPFKYVYLHGLVRDEKGRKMSKSFGNVIDPIEVIDKYGADALRIALVSGTTWGNDSNIGEEKIKGARNFSNKIWNASRFVAYYLDKNIKGTKRANKDFDKKLSEVVKNVTLNLEKLRVGQAAAVLQNEFWHWFCDKALEQTKKGEISALKIEQGLETFLKLLHPFMPFITEAIWQDILNKRGLLIKESWPK